MLHCVGVAWTSADLDLDKSNKLDAHHQSPTKKESSTRYRMILVATELMVRLHGNDDYDLSACWKVVSSLATEFLDNPVCVKICACAPLVVSATMLLCQPIGRVLLS